MHPTFLCRFAAATLILTLLPALSHAKRRQDRPIEIRRAWYETAMFPSEPHRKHERLGYVTVEETGTVPELIERARIKASRMGADAVYGLAIDAKLLNYRDDSFGLAWASEQRGLHSYGKHWKREKRLHRITAYAIRWQRD